MGHQDRARHPCAGGVAQRLRPVPDVPGRPRASRGRFLRLSICDFLPVPNVPIKDTYLPRSEGHTARSCNARVVSPTAPPYRPKSGTLGTEAVSRVPAPNCRPQIFRGRTARNGDVPKGPGEPPLQRVLPRIGQRSRKEPDMKRAPIRNEGALRCQWCAKTLPGPDPLKPRLPRSGRFSEHSPAPVRVVKEDNVS